MKILENRTSVYFVGIGGIGMSALARFAMLKNKEVFGYDKTITQLTATLSKEGMEITYVDAVAQLPLHKISAQNTLVVYTPAIPADSLILKYFNANNYTVIKRSKFLGEVTRDTQCLAVAGTHGKTTTSAILGHLLLACNMPVTAFLGGIATNYNSNFISNGTQITVVEADEFDRSFLTLNPTIACVTSMDADHLDIYGTASEIESSFTAFAQLVPSTHNLLYKKGLPLSGQSVAIEENAAFEARHVRIENGGYVFDLKTPTQIIKNLTFFLPGHHNLHNATMALGMALLAGAPDHKLPEALATFSGVDRRFSYRIRRDDLVLIDDYAHHPTELAALHQAVEEMYPGEDAIIVFQPHLYSRTRDFVEGFAETLSTFNQVLLLDIYPAREKPIEGVTSQWLLDKINILRKATGLAKATLVTKQALPEKLKEATCKVKLLVGAGDIGAEVATITNYLEK